MGWMNTNVQNEYWAEYLSTHAHRWYEPKPPQVPNQQHSHVPASHSSTYLPTYIIYTYLYSTSCTALVPIQVVLTTDSFTEAYGGTLFDR